MLAQKEDEMAGKAVVSLATGLEDTEKVTVALLVAVGAAESGRPTLTFLTKEAVRLAIDGFAQGVGCDGCPSVPELIARYVAASGTWLVCPICLNSRGLQDAKLIDGATVGGTVPMWEWVGDGATTFSY
jgi:predicted peroxiredoxin